MTPGTPAAQAVALRASRHARRTRDRASGSSVSSRPTVDRRGRGSMSARGQATWRRAVAEHGIRAVGDRHRHAMAGRRAPPRGARRRHTSISSAATPSTCHSPIGTFARVVSVGTIEHCATPSGRSAKSTTRAGARRRRQASDGESLHHADRAARRGVGRRLRAASDGRSVRALARRSGLRAPPSTVVARAATRACDARDSAPCASSAASLLRDRARTARRCCSGRVGAYERRDGIPARRARASRRRRRCSKRSGVAA